MGKFALAEIRWWTLVSGLLLVGFSIDYWRSHERKAGWAWALGLAVYVAFLTSYNWMEREAMWERWQQHWQTEYEQRQATFEAQLQGQWKEWQKVRKAIPERQKWTVPRWGAK